jgi:hypothetical protein
MSQQWFYTRDGKTKIGPVSAAELQALTIAGQLLPTDMVLKQGTKHWRTGGSIKGLFAHLDSHRPQFKAKPIELTGNAAPALIPRTRRLFWALSLTAGAVCLGLVSVAVAAFVMRQMDRNRDRNEVAAATETDPESRLQHKPPPDAEPKPEVKAKTEPSQPMPDPKPENKAKPDPTPALEGKPFRVIHEKGLSLGKVVFNNGNKFAAVPNGRYVNVWEVASASLKASIDAYGIPPATAFSPDGKTLAVLVGNVIKLWDVTAQKERSLGPFETPNSGYVLAFSLSGKMVLTSDGTGLKLWDIESGQRKRTLRSATRNYVVNGPVLFVRHDKSVVVPLPREGLSLLDVERDEIQHLPGHKHVRDISIVLDPSGKLVASGSPDESVRFGT